MQWTGKLIGGALGAFFGPVGHRSGRGHRAPVRHRRAGWSGASAGRAVLPQHLPHHGACGQGRWSRDRARDRSGAIGDAGPAPEPGPGAVPPSRISPRASRPDFDLEAELAELRSSCGAHPEILRVFLEIQLRFALAGSDMVGAARAARHARGAGRGRRRRRLLARMEAAMRGGDPRAAAPAGRLASRPASLPPTARWKWTPDDHQ